MHFGSITINVVFKLVDFVLDCKLQNKESHTRKKWSSFPLISPPTFAIFASKYQNPLEDTVIYLYIGVKVSRQQLQNQFRKQTLIEFMYTFTISCNIASGMRYTPWKTFEWDNHSCDLLCCQAGKHTIDMRINISISMNNCAKDVLSIPAHIHVFMRTSTFTE